MDDNRKINLNRMEWHGLFVWFRWKQVTGASQHANAPSCSEKYKQSLDHLRNDQLLSKASSSQLKGTKKKIQHWWWAVRNLRGQKTYASPEVPGGARTSFWQRCKALESDVKIKWREWLFVAGTREGR